VESVTYQCGDIVVDPANRRFTRREDEVELEPKVFSVILELLARPNALLTRDQLLDAVWGHRYVTPSTLNRAIVLARKAFADDSGGSSYIQTVHGAGYRYVGPFKLLTVPSPEPRARFAPPPSAQIPGRVTELIGRADEITQIAGLLNSHRAVTLLGAGGMGKTQCALEFARQNVARYPDGIWFSDLAPRQDSAEWLEDFAVSLSISPKNEPDLIAKVASVLADRHALLLLDNCDRISQKVGAIVVELLRRTDQLRVLATSQQQLDFVGECVLRIPPLAVPSPDIVPGEDTLPEILSTPAVTLLIQRIQAIQTTFELNADNARAIIHICRALDGMPLALELAATRFALLSAEQVLDRLDKRFRFLVGNVAGRDHRHQTLLALIDWSYALLSADEQRLLCWLGVFVQGWSVDAAGELSTAMELDADGLIDLLTGLVKKSFVVVEAASFTPRYRLLESIRDFALDRLASRGEEARARHAHLACVRTMSLKAHAVMQSNQMTERVKQLKFEHANIEAALEWAQRTAHHEAALEIVGSLLLYIKAHGAMIAGRAWSDAALASTHRVRSRMRARALLVRGIIEVHLQSSSTEAERLLTQAWELARDTGDEWGLACAAGYRALDLAESGRAEAAKEFVYSAERLANRLEDDWLRGLAGLAQGWVHMSNGDLSRAIETLQKVRHLGHDLHQRHFIDMYIGLSMYGLGEWRLAAGLWHDAMRNALQVQHVRGVAGSVEGCAYIYAQRGSADQALRLLSAAAETRSRTHIPLFSFWVPYHEAAIDKARTALEPEEFARIATYGAAARPEDAANEAFEALAGFAR
jgi:predicted ATPase/DNA-binding winged helix-turn-helix (wHTH) protein